MMSPSTASHNIIKPNSLKIFEVSSRDDFYLKTFTKYFSMVVTTSKYKIRQNTGNFYFCFGML